MKSFFIISFILLGSVTFINNDIGAQVKNEYRINLYNGLSTNCVYGTTVDHLGYLWLATNNSVYRYNGYNLSKYDLSEGLPNNDVWGLTKDSKDRLWLQTITNEVGYIYNNKYHRVYVPTKQKTFYPKAFIEREGNMFFLNPETNIQALYVVYNDTLHFTGKHFVGETINNSTGNNQFISLSPQTITMYEFMAGNNSGPQYRTANRLPWAPGEGRYMAYGNYLIYGKYRSRFFLRQHLLTSEVTKVGFTDGAGKDDAILFICMLGKKICVLTDHALHIVDTAFNPTASYPISSFVNKPDNLAGHVSQINQDRFWGDITSTLTQGVIINRPGAPGFMKIPGADLAPYKYIAGQADTSYWWNQNDRMLLVIDGKGNLSRRQYSFLFDVVKMVPFDKDRMLLLTKSALHWFFNRSHTISPEKITDVDSNLKEIDIYHREIVVTGTKDIFLSGYDFLHSTIKGNRIVHKTLNSGNRYSYIEFDSLFKAFWLYNNDQILYRPFQGREVSIYRELFHLYGIKNIEKLVRDKTSGLLFLKDYVNLYKIDLVKHTVRRLFKSYNLENALFYISDNKIVLAGKFGVLFCPVNAAEDAAILSPNIKNSFYFKVEDAAVTEHKVILKTDQGFYSLPIPGDDLFKRQPVLSPLYKVILEYRDTLYNIVNQHMFHIVPGARNLGVDIINPGGNGSLVIQYFIEGVDTSWNVLNSNKIVLPVLAPLKKYVLYLKAGDDVWNSRVISVVLYMAPLWWQTRAWQITFWLAGSITALSILLAVMLLTRGYVIRAGREKQNSIMLELRAIYAQLNPHFIFNTLNTALYFIKKKQIDHAAAHVTTFSHLLRAYLESSRNRYITIDDEITNLKNYIQLEQKRFEDIFTYEIVNHTTPYGTIYIPSLLLQPIVENAINHGLLPKGNAGHLKIEFDRNLDKSIVCIVDDNGIGRQQAEALKQEHTPARTSHGSRLVRELIDAFNKYEKLGIEITYTDKTAPLSGTLVTILIKAPHDK